MTKPEDFVEAFAAIIREQLEALHVLPTPVVTGNRAKILEFIVQQRLPALSPVSAYAREGFRMSYGYDVVGAWARVGSYVDRILKGANRAELPVDRSGPVSAHHQSEDRSRKAGFDVTSLLSRADEVIE